MNSDVIALDCETYDTALKGICDIFEIQESDLLRFLEDSNLNVEHATKHSKEMPFEEFLYNAFITGFNCTPISITKVCWFHLARTLDPQSYENGIFPLGKIKDRLFSEMYQLISDKFTPEEWEEIIRSPGGRNHLAYGERVGNVMLHGCYAMLINEEAFLSEEFNAHDYLAIPEIVEDLCYAVEEKYGIDLMALYKAYSSSIIVKFFTFPSDFSEQQRILTTVLSYLRSKCLNTELTGLYYGFAAQNEIIPPEQIIQIETVSAFGAQYMEKTTLQKNH
jgi:hypothetical protein